MASVIQIFEHERLTTTPDSLNRHITPSQLNKLCDFNDHNQNKYFTVVRDGVKFGQYVGVIQIGSLTIEILPKADRQFEYLNKEKPENELFKWQKVLLQMLALSGYVKLESVSDASLKKRFTLLDLYFDIFLNELEFLLRKGLIKQYRRITKNVNSLKGGLHFPKHILQNLIHQERFHTAHQYYDHEHLLNQILLSALNILARISINPALSDKIKRVKFGFPEIKEERITLDSFSQLVVNRKTEAYQEAIKIAKMIILNYSPDITRGEDDMLALLFDMNKLWENYIYRMLKRNEVNGNGYEIFYHQNKIFWDNNRIYPDIVIKEKETSNVFIIDTKWKIVEPNKPSDADLKQMYVYNMYWGAARSMLLYPSREGLQEMKYFEPFYEGEESKFQNSCKVGFVNVLKDDRLNKEVHKCIFEKLNEILLIPNQK